MVDFDSVSSLTETLKGQDALVDATSTPDPSLSIRLIDAAVAAGVYRVLPAEFSSDPENTKARALPPFQGERVVYEYIQKLGNENKITWTAMSNTAFLDWGLRMGFVGIDLVNKKIDYMNDGTMVVPWTLLSSVSEAVVNVLSKPEHTKNRVCHISNIQKSQKDVSALFNNEIKQKSQLKTPEIINGEF